MKLNNLISPIKHPIINNNNCQQQQQQQQPNHHTGFTNTNNETMNTQLNQVLILLQTLQSQAKKISMFQDQTYQWNLKHHQNLKNVLKSFNRLNSIIDSKGNNKSTSDSGGDSSISNNVNNNNSETTIDNSFEIESNKSYHQKIIEVYDPLDPFSDDLQYLIMQIDKSLFSQLRDESIEIVYPFILKWLKEENSLAIIVLSLVILWETSIKFPNLKSNPKFRDLNKKILFCLKDLESKGIINNMLHNQDVFPFSDEEYFNLKKFLDF